MILYQSPVSLAYFTGQNLKTPQNGRKYVFSELLVIFCFKIDAIYGGMLKPV